MQNSTIIRVLEESKETIDNDLLVDFILETASTHFVMFKYVELNKLSEDKVVKLIEFLDCQEESSKKMYLEYITFNVSFIKNLLNKYNKDLKEMKNELNETKNLCEEKDIEIKELKEELNKMKIEEKQMKEELDECKREKKQVKESTKVKKVTIKNIHNLLSFVVMLRIKDLAKNRIINLKMDIQSSLLQ